MPGSKSDTCENLLLTVLLGGTYTNNVTESWKLGYGFTGGTLVTPYLALFTAPPDDTGGGTEATGGSYARVSLAAKMGTVANGQVTNTTAVSFATPTANWGTIVAAAIFDRSGTSGQIMLWWSTIPVKTVNTGDTVTFPIGSIVITED